MVIVAPIVAICGALVLYGILQPAHRGPSATFWNRWRATLLPRLHRLAQRLRLGYAAYELHPSEYAGRIDAPVEDVDRLLAAYGFERMPLSAWKTLPDGRSEAGSWARRDDLLADRQLHVMLFRTEEGATDVYAHDEFNAFHPAHATKHYHSVDYCPQKGQQQLRELIGEYLYDPAAEPLGDAEQTTADVEKSPTDAEQPATDGGTKDEEPA